MSTQEQAIAQLVVYIGQNITNAYVDMSAICFISYDILINLDREVEHIWKARWSVSKGLFIIGRYYGLFYIIATFIVSVTAGLPLNFCRPWMWFETMAGYNFFTTVVNVILVMRLYALYGDRKVLVFFSLLVICEFAFEFYACIIVGIENDRTLHTLPAGIPLGGCFSAPTLTNILWSLVPCMVIATSFFVMTVAKVVSGGYGTLMWPMDVSHAPPLVMAMVRDGAVYYFLMFSILLITTFFFELEDGFKVITSMPWLAAIYSLTASRLVLNLREMGSQTVHGTGLIGFRTNTAPIEFAVVDEQTVRETESSS